MTTRSHAQDTALAVLGFVFLVVWDISGLDMRIMQHWGSPHGFALTHAFWMQTVLHEGGRDVGWFALLLTCIAAWRGAFGIRAARWRAAIATMLGCVLLISFIKHHSLTSCPWDLREFGGKAQYISHWRWGLKDGGGGQCFPSGHASTGFAFFSLYFLWRDIDIVKAKWALRTVLSSGLIFGAVQMMRGAHYPSHTLWTAWICWTFTAVCCRWAWPKLKESQAPGLFDVKRVNG
jgi:membrane-associated PAP2 superfamily phosphatase